MAILATYQQSSSEIKTYTIDYSQWLETGEVIDTHSSAITPATTPAMTASIAKNNDADGLVVSLGGGVNDTIYSVVLQITTTASPAQVKEICLEIECLAVCEQ